MNKYDDLIAELGQLHIELAEIDGKLITLEEMILHTYPKLLSDPPELTLKKYFDSLLENISGRLQLVHENELADATALTKSQITNSMHVDEMRRQYGV